MRQSVSKALLLTFLAWLPVVSACGGGDGGEPTHTVDKAGVLHRDGLEDPLNNCVECHGADLRGDRGPDCHSCHADPRSHSANRGGVAHDPGDTSTCSACHGPDNSGGLGPACSNCH